jgi:hypothetical protein
LIIVGEREIIVVCNLAILSDIEIRDPQAYLVMSAENFIEDYLHYDDLPVPSIVTSAFQEALGIQESILWIWLSRSGAQSRKLYQRFFQELVLVHMAKVIVHIFPGNNCALAMLRAGILITLRLVTCKNTFHLSH